MWGLNSATRLASILAGSRLAGEETGAAAKAVVFIWRREGDG